MATKIMAMLVKAKEVENRMYKELMQAVAGKIFAAVMCKIYKADKYILFPDSKGAYRKWGIRLLPQYLRQNKFNRVIVMAADGSIKQEMVRQGITNVQFKTISKYSINCFLNYYALKDMSEKWIVVSTKKPYDTGAERLLGVKGVTYRDIIYYDIYKLDGEVT